MTRRETRRRIVLVVEDDPDVRELIVEGLQKLPVLVLQGADGESARVEIRRAAAIDLLITDVMLPGGTHGVELAEQARRSHPTMQVLFVTGYAERPLLERGLLASDAPLLKKPFRLAELLDQVRRLLALEEAPAR